MARGLKFTKTVRAKGRTYVYFDTGRKDARGRTIYNRLPAAGTAQFGAAYASMLAARTRRESVPGLLTVKDLIRLYQTSPKFGELADKTQWIYARYLSVLEDQIGNAPANEVESRDIAMLMDMRGETPAAANMLRQVTGALYRWGRSRSHVTIEPTKGIEMFEGGEHEPWPEDLLNAALESDDMNVRLTTALLYYTAQRLDDVRLLHRGAIKDGAIRLRQKKTGKDMVIPVHSELAKVLAQVPKHGLLVIAKPDGTAFSDQTLRKWLQGFAKKRGFRIVPHGLRKNAVNALLEAGCSAAETAAISGQSLQLVEHYAKRRDTTKLGESAILKWQNKERTGKQTGKPS